jgi:uncharacterized protein YbjT (DUF2867 family)
MVVGAGSESHRTLRYLVQRLPVMIGPAWLATPTQAIGIDDVISYLAQAPDVPESEGREVRIGGPDVLSTPTKVTDPSGAALTEGDDGGGRLLPLPPFPL